MTPPFCLFDLDEKRRNAKFWKMGALGLAARSLGWCVVMWAGRLGGVLGVRAIDESAADI